MNPHTHNSTYTHIYIYTHSTNKDSFKIAKLLVAIALS
jgi:hypothetical protein